MSKFGTIGFLSEFFGSSCIITIQYLRLSFSHFICSVIPTMVVMIFCMLSCSHRSEIVPNIVRGITIFVMNLGPSQKRGVMMLLPDKPMFKDVSSNIGKSMFREVKVPVTALINVQIIYQSVFISYLTLLDAARRRTFTSSTVPMCKMLNSISLRDEGYFSSTSALAKIRSQKSLKINKNWPFLKVQDSFSRGWYR